MRSTRAPSFQTISLACQIVWEFSENINYLWQLGALDELGASKPRVIIPNYISGLSNCVVIQCEH